MRLVRLAAAGLGLGMLVGFGAALLRPRPRTAPTDPGVATGVPTSQAAFDAFGPAPRDPTNPRPDPATGPAERPVGTAAADVDTDRPGPGTVIR